MALNLFGITGLTAYFDVLDIGHTKEGETFARLSAHCPNGVLRQFAVPRSTRLWPHQPQGAPCALRRHLDARYEDASARSGQLFQSAAKRGRMERFITVKPVTCGNAEVQRDARHVALGANVALTVPSLLLSVGQVFCGYQITRSACRAIRSCARLPAQDVELGGPDQLAGSNKPPVWSQHDPKPNYGFLPAAHPTPFQCELKRRSHSVSAAVSPGDAVRSGYFVGRPPQRTVDEFFPSGLSIDASGEFGRFRCHRDEVARIEARSNSLSAPSGFLARRDPQRRARPKRPYIIPSCRA